MKKVFFPITKNNKIDFLKNGTSYYQKYIDAISSAKVSIHLQTYIFELDEFGLRVQNELISAAKRGVKVYLLVDSIGTRKMSDEGQKAFTSNGIHFCFYNSIQLQWLYRWGHRLHHKILLIDEKEAFVGGINILSPYLPESSCPQLDFAVFISGPVTVELTLYCKLIFQKVSKEKLTLFHSSEYNQYESGHSVGISVNDWIHGRSKITRQYSSMTTQSKKQITIINSYFFPRRKFMRQLAAAAKRGVKVRLILPKYSDWPSYVLASEYLYNYFLKRNVEIYQWSKSVLHGKLATVDDDWSTIGSFNLNYTSYQQNLEMNLDVYSKDFNQFLNNEIDSIITDGCKKIEFKDFNENYSFKVRALRFFYYIILSVVANFSIATSFQENHKNEHRTLQILSISGSIVFLLLGIIGAMLPNFPAIPFFIISFLLLFKQIIHNNKW